MQRFDVLSGTWALASSATYALLILVVSVLIASTTYWLCRDKRLDGLQGPKGNPITGIGLELPPNAVNKFREWADEYGEVFKFRLGWWNWVVLNSPEAIKQVMDKQSASTSSKTPAPMAGLLVGDRRMPSMQYGPRWRAYRALCHQILTPKSTEAMMPIQIEEVRHFMLEMAKSHDEDDAQFDQHIHRTLFASLMRTVYGRRVQKHDDDDIKYNKESGKILANSKFVEDAFPPLLKLPEWLQPSRKKVLGDAKLVLWVKMRMWNRLKEEWAKATSQGPTCYAAQMYQSGFQKRGLEEEDLAWIAGGLVDAGSLTTTHTLTTLVHYLAANPEVQRRAREEIDSVVDQSRTPGFDDIPRLPYVFACVKEANRLCFVPPWSVAHFTDTDVTYKDVVIPKGTTVVCNTAALNLDAARYPDPMAFKPERYLGYQRSALEYAALPDAYERDHFSFGVGRRICPGARFAENTLAFAITNILWGFEIKPPMTMADGKIKEAQIDLSEDTFDYYPVRHARSVKARFMPLGDERMQVIRRDHESYSHTK